MKIVELREGGGLATYRSDLKVQFSLQEGFLVLMSDPETSRGGLIHIQHEDFIKPHASGEKIFSVRMKNLMQNVHSAEDLSQLVVKVLGVQPQAGDIGHLGNNIGAQAIRQWIENHRVRGLHLQSSALTEPANLQVESVPALGQFRYRRPMASPSSVAVERPRRVMIVDDAKPMRMLLKKILSADPQLTIAAEAGSAAEAEALLPQINPDVITLDIHMPGENGVSFLSRYLKTHPIPTVLVTSVSKEEGDLVFEALSLGAVDYIQKPGFSELDEMATVICEKVRTASKASVKRNKLTAAGSNNSVVALRERAHKTTKTTKATNAKAASIKDSIVVIGASTGGVQALTHIFTNLPESTPPIVVVQHIPPVFSRAFADRLNAISKVRIKEAEDGDLVLPNQVLLAPGGLQMKLEKQGGKLVVRVFDGPKVNRHKPSVDILFHSAAEVLGAQAFGIILTGMGEDGAAGMYEMRKKGAHTLAQDEASCVVFGMPGSAIRRGAVERVLPLSEIAKELA